jgi:hypothetical protein
MLLFCFMFLVISSVCGVGDVDPVRVHQRLFARGATPAILQSRLLRPRAYFLELQKTPKGSSPQI